MVELPQPRAHHLRTYCAPLEVVSVCPACPARGLAGQPVLNESWKPLLVPSNDTVVDLKEVQSMAQPHAAHGFLKLNRCVPVAMVSARSLPRWVSQDSALRTIGG